MATNYERLLQNIGEEKKPFIVCDVETTGLMNGNDNRVTQIALASYDYNKSTGQYELQDKIFMLRKADKKVLENIEKNEIPNRDNAEQQLYEEYKYNITREIKAVEKKKSVAESKGDAHNESLYAGQLQTLYEKRAYFDNIPSYKEVQRIETNISNPIARGFLDNAISEVVSRVDIKIEEMQKATKLVDILKLQGIKLDDYRKEREGLTDSELAIGVANFLKKYQKDDTVFVNNGAYSTAHYLEKSGIVIGNKENTIDLTQAERSMHGGKSEWTADVSRFAENYTKDTGNEIKYFDAFTKALCMGEMTVSACDLTLVNTSEKYLENMVKEQAESKDEDYVMSQTRAMSLDWVFADRRDFEYADYHFDSLEYVDFGNDRRYVDIDKMFEVNDNFEVTLEGEKTPIKTWEELGAKIKALNSDISKELLEQIHEKYLEISDRAVEQKNEQKLEDIPEPMKENIEKVRNTETEKTKAEEILEAKESQLASLISQLKKTTDKTDETRQALRNKEELLRQKFLDKVTPVFNGMLELQKQLTKAQLGTIPETEVKINGTKYVIASFYNSMTEANEINILNKSREVHLCKYQNEIASIPTLRSSESSYKEPVPIESYEEILKVLPKIRDVYYDKVMDILNEKIKLQDTAREKIEDTLDAYENLEQKIEETDFER